MRRVGILHVHSDHTEDEEAKKTPPDLDLPQQLLHVQPNFQQVATFIREEGKCMDFLGTSIHELNPQTRKEGSYKLSAG